MVGNKLLGTFLVLLLGKAHVFSQTAGDSLRFVPLAGEVSYAVNKDSILTVYADSINHIAGQHVPGFLFDPCFDEGIPRAISFHDKEDWRWLVIKRVTNKQALKTLVDASDNRMRAVCKKKANTVSNVLSVYDFLSMRLTELEMADARIAVLSVLPLKNKQYGHDEYRLLHLCDLDSAGNQLKTTRRIVVSKADKTISAISLPVPDEEVKNFSVDEIAETPKGFKIAVDWGGGDYFYSRTFYFIFSDGRFYLDSWSGSSYVHSSGKQAKTTKKVNPPVALDKFDIRRYMENK